MNATIVVTELATTGHWTLSTPTSTVSSTSPPPEASISILSDNTIASSASIPSVISKANIVNKFNEMPVMSITKSVPQIATIIPSVTKHAALQCTPSRSVTNTSKPPCKALRVNKSSRSSINFAKSLCFWIETSSGPRLAPSNHPSIRFDPKNRSISDGFSGSLLRPATYPRVNCAISTASCLPFRKTVQFAEGSPLN